jgi:hypothetical protein
MLIVLFSDESQLCNLHALTSEQDLQLYVCFSTEQAP